MPTNELLHYWRERHHLTLQALADLIGAEFKTADNWEHRGTNPYPKQLEKLTALLGKSARELGFIIRKNEYPPIPYLKLDYPRNEFFTGREDILQRLHDQLVQLRPKDTLYCAALAGIGGVGKTHIAIEYAHRHILEYQTVVFLTASSKAELAEEFADLAYSLFHLLNREAQPGKERAIEAVKEWLGNFSRYLLIFDNVQDLSIVADFLPLKIKGDVIVITQSQSTGTYAKPIHVEPMTEDKEDEGIYFLLRRSKGIGKNMPLQEVPSTIIDLAREIVVLLGGLPLALDQAGAYLEGKDLGTALAKYADRYRRERKTLLGQRGQHPSPDHPESVTVTFSLALKRVKRANQLAIELLKFFAFLAPDTISEELILKNASVLGPRFQSFVSDPTVFEDVVDDAIDALLRYSLVRRKIGEEAISIHRLVQAVVKDRMNRATRWNWAARTVQAINAVFPRVKYGDGGQREKQYLLLLPHALECTQTIAVEKIYTREAVLLLNRCAINNIDFNEAERLYEEAVTVAERALGSEHPETDLVKFNQMLLSYCKWKDEATGCNALFRGPIGVLARVDWLENVVKREALAQDIIEINGLLQETVPELLAIEKNADNLEIDIDLECLAERLGDTAYACRYEGKYTEAVTLLEKMIEIFEKLWGEMYVQIPNDLCTLGELYCTQGKYTEAQPLYERALTIDEKHAAQDAEILSEAGLFYLNWGKYEQAEPLLLQALAIQEKIAASEDRKEFKSGEIHKVADKLEDLAKLYAAQKKDEQAKQLYLRALGILGYLIKEYPFYINTPSLKHFIALSEQTLGPEHPRTADGLYALAILYQENNKLEQAEPLLLRAIAIREKEPVPGHPETAKTLHYLGALYHDQGKLEEAEQLFQRVLTIFEEAHDTEYSAIESAFLAYLYEEMGRDEKAEPLYERALPFFDKMYVKTDKPDQREHRVRHNYIGLLRRQSREQEAAAQVATAQERGLVLLDTLPPVNFLYLF